MKSFSVREIVEQAVQTEKLGYEFYTLMAGKFKEKEGFSDFFKELAVKERQHEKIFSGLRNKVGDEEIEGQEEVEQYLKAIVESEFFLGKNKSLPLLKYVKTAADAVKFALGFERETLLYFYKLRDVIKEKKIVDEIIKEEQSHIVWLNEYKTKLK